MRRRIPNGMEKLEVGSTDAAAEWKERIKRQVKCCCCEASLEKSKYINIVGTTKVASWKFPIMQNVLVANAPAMAIAILCDQCVNTKQHPKCVIEADPGYSKVTYHEIGSLEDEPQECRDARAALDGPNPQMN